VRTIVPGLALAGYLLVLFDLTLVRFPQPGAPANWMPLAGLARSWAGGGRLLLVNVAGNLAAFVPLGVLAHCLPPRRVGIGRVLLAGAALSLGIESLQYLSGRRVADVDDVLLNALGAVLGHAAIPLGRRMRALRHPASRVAGCGVGRRREA